METCLKHSEMFKRFKDLPDMIDQYPYLPELMLLLL